MSIRPWLRLFRVPNLPTAPGDAVAGGAVAVLAAAFAGEPAAPFAGRAVAAALVAGLAELLLYMGGLADNDLVDETADRAAGSDRPLATGALPRRAVRIARALCFAGAAAIGLAARPGPGWWAAAAGVVAAILLYNRLKERLPRLGFLLMGACRGLAVLSGAAAAKAAFPPGLPPTANGCDPFLFPDILALSMAAGWTLYTAAVTWLGAGEERAGAGLGRTRFLPAAVCLVPVWLPLRWICDALAAPHPTWSAADVRLAATPVVGCLAAAAAWCAAVAPLGGPHGPPERGRAVGRAIGGLLWMQTGFLCASVGPDGAPVPAFLAFAVACWLLRVAIRALAPNITGS